VFGWMWMPCSAETSTDFGMLPVKVARAPSTLHSSRSWPLRELGFNPPPAAMNRVTVVCFLASYGVALALELLYLLRPRPILRFLSLGFGAAGLLAHSMYLAWQRPPLAGQYGLLLSIAWILAIFYLYGSVHHSRLAWGVFVLPLILGLVTMAAALGPPPPGSD